MDVKNIQSKFGERCAVSASSGFFLTMLLGAAFFSAAAIFAQEPAQPAPPPPESSSAKPAAAKPASKHGDDFLLRGTVFTPEGLALPGAELRVRRTAEKKPKWETMTNSRGDFAVRVKMGSDYEVVVRARGFKDQSVSVDAKTGERFKDLVFRMEHQEGKKS
jgi:hypothetical protein